MAHSPRRIMTILVIAATPLLLAFSCPNEPGIIESKPLPPGIFPTASPSPTPEDPTAAFGDFARTGLSPDGPPTWLPKITEVAWTPAGVLTARTTIDDPKFGLGTARSICTGLVKWATQTGRQPWTGLTVFDAHGTALVTRTVPVRC
jgi:hypothetical protein